MFFYIGIDLSDKFFDSCITNSFGDVISRSRFDFDEHGFSAFLCELQEHEVSSKKCAIGLENPRSRLVDFLIQREYTVLLTNPKSIARYRESRIASKAKSDQADAQLISDYIREHHRSLRRISIPDETVRELSLLLEDRDRLVQQKVRFSNQLTSTLKEYFPQALAMFSCITGKSALEFLKRVDTFAQLKSIASGSTTEIEQLLVDCGINREDSKERFYSAMEKSVSQVSQAVIRAKVRLKNAILNHLVLLTEQIADYERQIQQIMDEMTYGDLFRSLPGADYILAGKLLVLYSSRDFCSASEVQSLCGTVPYTVRSGQSKVVRFRKGCSKFGRKSFHQLAFSSLRSCQWSKKRLSKKRKEGKGLHHSLRCLANSWVKVTFAMWRDKTPYDESRYLVSVASHIINQPDSVLGG
jgi:transposase